MSGAVVPLVHGEYQRHLQRPRIVVSKKCHISHRVLLMVSCLFRLQTVPWGRSPETAPGLPSRLCFSILFYFLFYLLIYLFIFVHFFCHKSECNSSGSKLASLIESECTSRGQEETTATETPWWSDVAAEPLTPTAGKRRQTQPLQSLKCLADVGAAAAAVVVFVVAFPSWKPFSRELPGLCAADVTNALVANFSLQFDFFCWTFFISITIQGYAPSGLKKSSSTPTSCH